MIDDNLRKVLAYGQEKHTRVRDAIILRNKSSKEKRDLKRKDYERIDQDCMMYKKPSPGDQNARSEKSKGNPEYETLVVPYSYGMMMTAHTYLATVFLARNPIFQIDALAEAVGDSTQCMESFLDYQTRVGGNTAKYYSWLFDYLRYGEGIIGTYWDEETVTFSQIEEVPEIVDGIDTQRKLKKRVTKSIPKYTGNRTFNVHPLDFRHDPRVSIARFQDGEFCGRETTISWSEFMAGVASGRYFNSRAALAAVNGKKDGQTEVTPNQHLPDPSQEIETSALDLEVKTGKAHMDAIEMYVRCIPKDWGLSDSNALEIWCFTVVNNSVVIEAESLGLLHGQFPYDVMAFEFDSYTLFSRGFMEMSKPMNDAMTWLLNSHMFNVRKILNNELIYDPSRINEEDLTRPKAGRLVRLKPTAYGTDVRATYSQLQVTDVTRGHLDGLKVLSDLMKQVFGINDNLMGLVTPGGRKTATEVRTSSTMSANRLQTYSEYTSAHAWYKHVEKLISNTQQFYTGEQKIKIAGNLHAPVQSQYMTVTPETISGKFEYIPVDGTMPIDRFAQANLYKELLVASQQMPAISQRYDVARIFGFAMQLAGVRNLRNFEMAPSQKIEQQVSAGNLVPVDGQPK